MENNTPTMEVSSIDQIIGNSYDSSFTSTNLSDEPKATEPAPDVKPEVQQAEPTTISESGIDNNSQPEDSFTAIPYDELDDKLKPLHKSLQADYTRKRQLERQQVKDLEAKLKELESKLQSNPIKEAGEESDPDTYVSEEERIRNYIKLERESEWEKQASKEIEMIDGRLNENHPEYDKLFDDYARENLERSLNEYIEKEGTKIGFDYKAKLAELSDSWNSYIDKRIKTYISKQNEMIKKKAEEAKKSNPETKSAAVEKSGRMSIHDAIESAFSK